MAPPLKAKSKQSKFPPVARRRRFLFGLAAASLVPVLLVLSEIALRLAGVGYPTSFFLKRGADLVDNPKFGWRFFPRTMARTPRPMRIPARKPANTTRIFVFGESAAYGDPDPAFGFPRILEVLLRERFPEKRFEVINVAMTAINSHTILPIARDCADKQGDIWVLYIGNNEVVGPFGAGTVFGKKTLTLPGIRATLAARKLRIGQALDLAIQNAHGSSIVFAGMEMFSENKVSSDDSRLARVYDHFQSNLRDIVAQGLAAKAQVILCTVPSNLKDCAPFASTNRINGDAAEWQKAFDQGTNAQKKTEPGKAVDAFQTALKLDPRHAETLFRLAKCDWQLGRTNEAAKLFAQARDEDLLRFRADSRENEIVRSIASKKQVQLLDIERAFGPAAGSEVFYEHVHLNFSGNYRVARLIAESLAPQKNISWLPERDCAERLAFTPWNRMKIAETLRQRMQRPPFTFQYDHVAPLLDRISPDAFQQSVVAYRAAIASRAEDWTLHDSFGLLLAGIRDFTNAASEGRKVAEHLQFHPEKWAQLGIYLEAAGRVDEARGAFEKAMALDKQSPEALFGLGKVNFAQGSTQEAERLLNEALKGRPAYAEARLALSEILTSQSRKQEAIQTLERILELEPDHPQARAALNKLRFPGDSLKDHVAELARLVGLNPPDVSLLVLFGQALAANGQVSEAAEQFAKATQIDPANGEAHYYYGEVLTRQNRGAEALHEFATAAQLMPKDVNARLNLGVALAQARRFEEALKEFETVLRLEPGHKTAQKYADLARSRLRP